jgi:soluble lytic murein transglycosylase-like protein
MLGMNVTWEKNKKTLVFKKEKNKPINSDFNFDDIVNIVKKYSTHYQIDYRLILAVIKKESSFRQNCVSPAGAIGIMQLMPKTAEYLNVNPYILEDNIKGGVKYLREMIDKYTKEIKNNIFNNFLLVERDILTLSLAAYNAGPGNVRKYQGIPPFPETQNYVTKVYEYYNSYKNN